MRVSKTVAVPDARAGMIRSGGIFGDGLTGWRVAAWGLAAGLLVPIIFVGAGVFGSTEGTSWDHVRAHLLGPAVRDTAILVCGVCLVALLLAVPAAWCVSAFRFPGRRVFSVLLVLPLAVPPYVAAYVTTETREAFVPVLVWVRQHWGIDAYLRLELIHRFAWLIVMLGGVLYPYVFLAARSVFAGAGRRLTDSARVLGAGPWAAFRSISLPLARPALVAGLFLVAMEVLNDYGAVKHFGVNTLTVVIFRTWFGLGELETARRLAGWVLLGICALLVVERWQRGRAAFGEERTAVAPRMRCTLRGMVVCWVVCAVPLALGLLYPVVTLVRWFAQSSPAGGHDGLAAATRHSLLLGVAVTGCCVLLALVIVGLARFSRHRPEHALARLSGVAGYASPGAVMAVGVLGIAAIARTWFPAQTWLGSFLISGALLWLVYALTARYVAVAAQLTRQGMSSLPESYDRASRSLGRSPAGTFFLIHLPLLRPALAGAAVLVFVDVCKELPLCLLLRPFDFETLGTWTFGLADQGQIFASAAPSLVLIGLCAAGLTLVEVFGWRQR